MAINAGTDGRSARRAKDSDELHLLRHDRRVRHALSTRTTTRSRCETTDGREFDVALTDTTYAELVRNLGEPYVDATGQMRDMLVPGRYLFAYGVFYPEGDGHVFEAKQHRLRRARARTSSSSSSRTGGSSRSASSPTSTSRPQFGDGDVDFRDYRTTLDADGQQGRQPPGDRHDLAAGLRLRDGLPADRRGPLPRGRRDGHRVPARAPAHRRHGRGRRLLVPRHRHRGAEREEDPRLRVRRRLRRDPGLRADLRARRPDADLPHHRRPADPGRHRRHDRALRPLLPRPRGRRLLLAPRPDHVRPPERRRSATTGRARTGTRSATTRRRT